MEDHFDVIGGGVCGAFVVFGALSVILYGPWRRTMDRNRRAGITEAVELEDLEDKKQGDEKMGRVSLTREIE